MDDEKLRFFEQSRAEQSRAEQRNYGIDALRLLTMLMIVIIHIIGQGGVWESTVGVKRTVVSSIDVFVVCAVDIYAIISGYVGYREGKYKGITSKFISLWLQVFFYSFGISIAAMIFTPSLISTEAVIKSVFPLLTSRYWYYSSYVVVLLLSPWINKMIALIDNKQLTMLVCILIGLFSVSNVITYSIDSDPFTLNKGYSAIWLIALYVVGAWLKKWRALQTKSIVKLVIMLLCDFALMCAVKYVVPNLYGIVSYTSPTVVIMAVLFVIIFSKITIKGILKKMIAFLAPASFGVYLIHVQPFVFSNIIKGAFSWIADSALIAIPFEIIICAMAIMAICLVVEKLRMVIFNLIGINRLATLLGSKIEVTLDKAFSKLLQ